MIAFGPSGACEEFKEAGLKTTEDMAGFLKARGLDCFEYSFGRGVRMGEDAAERICRAFFKEKIQISVHAPYFVNFSNPDPEMAERSYEYVLESAYALRSMGGKRVVFHPASQGKAEREAAVSLCEERLKVLCEKIYARGLQDTLFCPETMGRTAQIGTVEEIIRFARIDPVFVPCVDFGHVNARGQGCLKTTQDYLNILDEMIEKLGFSRMEHFHIHFSKIKYGPKGEICHLTFEDKEYGPEFAPLAEALYLRKLEPYIVCESAGTQTKDAMEMKRIYREIASE